VRFVPWQDLKALREAVTERTAAVMLEPIQGEGGVRPASPEFLRGAAEIAREKGALLAFDEIQCGLGRTGKMFAFQHAGVVPDLLTLAKPLGGGLPMGACLIKEEHAAALSPGDHGSTFGGNPVAAAASLAVLDRLTAPGFLDGVAKRGASLQRGLRKLARAHKALVGEVRGVGLMCGMDLKTPVAPVVAALRARGVLATRAGENTLRLLPPLVLKSAELRSFLETLGAVLDEAGRAGA
jgi:acetylornithine/LysW-gamma-L-lysine aminotransferase